MRRSLVSSLFLLVVMPFSTANAADDVSGAWELKLQWFGQDFNNRLTLTAAGDGYEGRMTGLLGTWRIIGTREGEQLSLKCQISSPELSKEDKASCGTLVAQVENGVMTGDGRFLRYDVVLTGARPSERPEGAPTAHTFDPSTYASNFSSALKPVLDVYPGDTVNTQTIDAGGIGEDGKRAWSWGNPQTGPFYVHGAMPGDTLVVHLKTLTLNRDMASMYGNQIAANGLNPFYVANLEKGNRADGIWTMDRKAGTASLTNPSEKLKNFTIDLKPMLGGVGVAPPSNQDIRAGDLGVFGGNMDYLGVAEGARLYLPVFQPGAYLYLGDAHGTQSDGELTGTGLETSMDVTFSVEVIEGWTLRQPWLEDDEHVMVMGIAGSLNDALREATTGMARWLTHTYDLDSSEVAMVIGTSLRYDIAEIVDPHINVVARIRKDVLAGITSE